MQYKEFTESHSKDLMEQISSILETHMIGRTVIVKGKKGKVLKQVGSDGKTESDEIYQVKFEDGTVADIPARDMEMQGDDNKKIGENEAEELVKEARYRPTPVSPGSRYPTQAKKTKKTDAHSRIPGMSHKGKEILMTMANVLDTTGGPHLNHDNIHGFTHHGVNQTLKAAHKHLEDNPSQRSSKQLALVKKELGEETKRVRVNTQSGTTERVSRDDLQAAGDVFDRFKRLKLAIADKQHAAHKKNRKNLKDHVELDERTSPLPKSTSFSSVYSYKDKDHKFVTKLTNIGGAVDRKRKEVRFNFDNAAARTRFRNKNKNVLKGI